jgi:hypothetical protein
MDLPAAGPALTADDQAARVFAWRRGFNATWLIDLGIKLKLFADLAAHPASTPASIAERLGLQRRHVEIWCQTAYAFELLDAATDGVFSLAPFMDQVLGSPGHPRYVGGYVQLGTDYATDDFRALRDAFVTGEGKPFQGRDDQFSSHVADATYGLQWLSARKLLPEMPARLAATLRRHGKRRGPLLLELTETEAIRDPSRLRRAMLRLKRLGIPVLLDDVTLGDHRWRITGLPFAGLKLDRSLTEALPHQMRARRFLRAILADAHTKGRYVIAEGVSNPLLRRITRSLGVDFAQGFLLGEPAPPRQNRGGQTLLSPARRGGRAP